MDFTRLGVWMRGCVSLGSIRESGLSFRPIATRSADRNCSSNRSFFAVGRREALAVVLGLASLLLIRRADIASKHVIGIVVGSVCGITVGIIGVIFFWLIVGHVVIGF